MTTWWGWHRAIQFSGRDVERVGRFVSSSTIDRRIIKWVMGVLVRFDQRGEHVKIVCLVCI